MQEFRLSRYIKKWIPWIAGICLIATAGVYFYLSKSQTYVASAVIKYDSEGAEEGLTPLGTELDVNEIKSSAIMAKVMEELELNDRIYSMDDLITRLNITEVADEDEEARKEAVLDEGEEYTYKPTTYIVSFEAGSDEGEMFARKILDKVLDVYFSEYSQNYLSTGYAANSLRDLDENAYDYIEMLEIIEDNLTETGTFLEQCMESDPYYRSSATGLSFGDLSGELNMIRSVDISSLFSRVLEYQISKDKELLLSNYRERIDNYEITNTVEEEQIADVVKIMDAYVEKMRESDNTNITYEYILDDVYDKNLLDSEGNVIGEGDQTVTYDQLIYSWRDHNDTKENALIDIAYCNYIISVFEKTSVSGEEYSSQEKEVADGITGLVEKMEKFYADIDETIEEYNAYSGARNISMLSSVAVDKSLNVLMYTLIAAIFLMIVCCGGAVLLGRLNDIVQYVFYTDHMTGLKNRTALDGYLNSNKKKIIGKGTACVTVSVENQYDINKTYGRTKGDQLLRFFAESLTEVFARMDIFPVYNGNAYFIILVNRVEVSDMDYILDRFQLLIDRRDFMEDAEIEYKIGWAESEHDDAYRLRELLSKAMASREKYVSGPGKNEAGGI